jgi:hypothetical protein
MVMAAAHDGKETLDEDVVVCRSTRRARLARAKPRNEKLLFMRGRLILSLVTEG